MKDNSKEILMTIIYFLMGIIFVFLTIFAISNKSQLIINILLLVDIVCIFLGYKLFKWRGY